MAIGIMALIIAHLEAHPFPDLLRPESSASLRMLQCLRDAPAMSPDLRVALQHLQAAESGSGGERQLEEARQHVLRALSYHELQPLKTTQAVDKINGGAKVNALPESVSAYVNHRIAPYANVRAVIEHYKEELTPLAQKNGFSLKIDDEVLVPRSNRSLADVSIALSGKTIEPAPLTPFTGEDANAWRLVAGVVRQTWFTDEPRVELRSLDDDFVPHQTLGEYRNPVRVAPSSMFANTDTRWYHVRIF